ncbi:MAG: endonuclease/exonuclease/phosphatase family protein [Verrucomicrobiales bacterium]|nr:endonuclease/exonuclease/phosphatase family protein [Verrucomicrobiales bacterium]
MSLRRKVEKVASLEADILVLQECSRADAEDLNSIGLTLNCWIGRNRHKGLALLSRPRFRIVAKAVEDVEWAIRGVSQGRRRIGVVCIWACAPDRGSRYVRQVHCGLDQGMLASLPQESAVIGDFNSNSRWDSKHGLRSHSRLVERLAQEGFRSAYHQMTGELQGNETIPTFFLHRRQTKPYHIDFGFLSSAWLRKLDGIEIGSPEEWLGHSDHMPVIMDLR